VVAQAFSSMAVLYVPSSDSDRLRKPWARLTVSVPYICSSAAHPPAVDSDSLVPLSPWAPWQPPLYPGTRERTLPSSGVGCARPCPRMRGAYAEWTTIPRIGVLSHPETQISPPHRQRMLKMHRTAPESDLWVPESESTRRVG